MHSRRWLAVALVAALTGPLSAQPKPNPLEPVFKTSRLDAPDTNVSQKFNSLARGNEALDPPSVAQKETLETMAKQTVYPITHFDQYTSVESDKAELAPRIEEKSVNKVIADLKGQLVIVAPGDLTVPPTKAQFCQHYGAAVVAAIDDVLKKATLPIVRANAVRMLAVLAESGAPAALEKVAALLDQKAPQVEVLYWALKGAEGAIGQYDPVRGWVGKNQFHALVKRVDEIVRDVPAVVSEQTFLPGGNNPALVADPKNPPAKVLTPEQVLTVQAFRLQAIRALGKVKTDVVTDKAGEGGVRTLYTLARVAASDPALVPAPSFREAGEAVIGLANAVPGSEVDTNVLATAAARGLTTFAADRLASPGAGDEGKAPAAHWRLYGKRLQAAFVGWEKEGLAKSKLPKAEKDVIADFITRAVPGVIDPLSKTDDRGQSPGLNGTELNKFLESKKASLKADQPLFRDAPATKLPLK